MDRSPRNSGISQAMSIAIGLLASAFIPAVARAQPAGSVGAAGAPFNRSLDEIRRASVSWEWRPGPERKVVDLVCLVPDLPSFLEVIATWDEAHAFPIL